MKPVGIGTRVLNHLIDMIIIFTISYIIQKINDSYGEQFKMYNQTFKYQFVFGYVYFFTMFFYYFFSELIFKRTVGKLVSFTKVISSDGTKPNLWQIMVRSIVRLTIIEFLIFPFYEKMLHDLLSKTIVVNNEEER